MSRADLILASCRRRSDYLNLRKPRSNYLLSSFNVTIRKAEGVIALQTQTTLRLEMPDWSLFSTSSSSFRACYQSVALLTCTLLLLEVWCQDGIVAARWEIGNESQTKCLICKMRMYPNLVPYVATRCKQKGYCWLQRF